MPWHGATTQSGRYGPNAFRNACGRSHTASGTKARPSNDGVQGISGGDARSAGERSNDPDPEIVLGDREMAGRSNVAGEDGPEPIHGALPAAVAAITGKLNNSAAAGV